MKYKENDINWIALIGKIKTRDNKLTYVPTNIENGPNKGQSSICIAKSNIEFESGIIEFYATLKDINSSCQLILSHDSETETFVGYNVGIAAFSINSRRGSTWDWIASAGDKGTIPINTKIKTVIDLKGSSIDLYVNDVKVCSGITQTIKSQLAIFLAGEKEIIIENFKYKKIEPKVFVVMQYSIKHKKLYDEVIKPICEKHGFEVIKADDIYTSTLILEDITKNIKEASIVIADITIDNPNVFYEVGYSHGIRKPTILLCDKEREKLPFDISGFRTLFYEDSIGGKRAIENNLKEYLNNINF